jgi:hypothetical protein
LGVVDHQFKFAPGNAAGCIDFIGGELNAVHLSDRCQREVAGLVLQDPELDRVRRMGRARSKQACSNEGSDARSPRNTFQHLILLCWV